MCQWVVQAAGPHEFQIQKGLAIAHSLLCVSSCDIYSLGHTSYSVHPLRIWIVMCLPTPQAMVAQASSLLLFFWFFILFRDCDYLVSCVTPWGLMCLEGTNIGFAKGIFNYICFIAAQCSRVRDLPKIPRVLRCQCTYLTLPPSQSESTPVYPT